MFGQEREGRENWKKDSLAALATLHLVPPPHLHSSESVESSCSRSEKICTISVMISGHAICAWAADIRTSTTRKHRKTAARTSGEQGIVRRLSAISPAEEK